MVVKLLFLITKKTGISQEEFESQYQPHIDKAVPILKKYGAVYYGMVRIHGSAIADPLYSPKNIISRYDSNGTGPPSNRLLSRQWAL